MINRSFIKESIVEQEDEPPPIYNISNNRIARVVSSIKKNFSLCSKRENFTGINCVYRKFAFSMGFAEFYNI